ncbi:MAG: nucleotidyltransferase domain-containing protein [Chloroflexi bacterium]|uniref:nucleotidyltransferase domain-containing protein n=1 Tax=Candidatus Flexifilum breve TaxID=3140694 RepID=UPI003136C851|nr:nucleotidyltransferase domain-containing protein [Chloroflexota bacterium]
MSPITRYSPQLDRLLPQTAALLKITRWQVHPGVLRVVLIGSRGLDGHPRPDSDIDLSLIVDPAMLPPAEPEREQFLRAVIETTLNSWQSPVEVDVAAPFGSPDALRMFSVRDYDAALVAHARRRSVCISCKRGSAGTCQRRCSTGARCIPCSPSGSGEFRQPRFEQDLL